MIVAIYVQLISSMKLGTFAGSDIQDFEPYKSLGTTSRSHQKCLSSSSLANMNGFLFGCFFISALLHAALCSPKFCSGGRAVYNVTFTNFLTPENFGDVIPPTGLVFSPLAGVSHSNRISVLTIRGFASPEIEAIAENGNNAPLLELARTLRMERGVVRSVVGASGPTMPGMNTTLELVVNCKNPFISVVSMIAPSPDWIVQINNFDTVMPDGEFISEASGMLIAYDGGTDSGDMFTDPADLSLDEPTEPPQNIAPLVEDPTDPFGDVAVGSFTVQRIDM